MAFVIKDFLEEPSIEVFDKLKREDLISLAKHFKISYKASMRKQEIKNVVIETLVDDHVFSEDALDLIKETSDIIRIKQIELEHQLKLAKMQQELDMQIRMKEMELASQSKIHVKSTNDIFDASKHIRLVPKFSEKNVDKYFPHFEKVAENLKWPKTVWSTLLQSVLEGKAAEVYASLSIEQSTNYDIVKQLILKAYELVPEAYRQRFRSYRKFDHQTHVEFAREKEELFDKWLTSSKVEKSYEKLRELMLIEEFKQGVYVDIKVHIDHKGADSLRQAATMADNYALTCKQNFVKKVNDSRSVDHSNSLSGNPNKAMKSKLIVKASDASQQGITNKSDLTCSYCKRKGHIISECFRLQKKKLYDSNVRPEACYRNSGINNDVKSSEVLSHSSSSNEYMDNYKPFISDGFVSLSENTAPKTVKILRDTGASQTLLLEGVLPLSDDTSTGESVLLQGMELSCISVPLHSIYLQSDLISGSVVVGVRPTLPIEGISLLLGNDLAGNMVIANPVISKNPLGICKLVNEPEQDNEVYPSCAITRAMSKMVCKETKVHDQIDDHFQGLHDSFMAYIDDDGSCDKQLVDGENYSATMVDDRGIGNDTISRSKLLLEQEKDPEILLLFEKVVSSDNVFQESVCFYLNDGVLMRKWRPPDATLEEEWKVIHQIVVPKVYRNEVLHIAHDSSLAGHLGVNKTYHKILNNFFWPGLKKDVSDYCRSCHICQVVGKPNQKVPIAPLKPIPAFEEPFSRVLIDCVGPLPKTKSGNLYMLTIMCTSTRFPEAIPLRNIKTTTIVKALVKFFTLFGLPKSLQSDQGSNFMSGVFQQVIHQLGIKQYKSSAYHPESQGALERFHQTLKNMIRTYCLEHHKDWDEGVHMLLFAAREAVQESLGFSPFELVFGHSVRGPLKLLKEKWLNDSNDINLLDYVCTFKQRLYEACNLARENLKKSQIKMKQWYDSDARKREFKAGDKVLLFLPIPTQPLQARYYGPYEIHSKVNDLNYIVKTPGRRKNTRLCHVNMLKTYVERDNDQAIKPIANIGCTTVDTGFGEEQVDTRIQLRNSECLFNLESKLDHLDKCQQQDIEILIQDYSSLFPDVPNQTSMIFHDVDIGESSPVKQHPYRVNPLKLEHMRNEIHYMLENNIIEESSSAWSSPCILVPKPDGSYRFCTDFRKVNVLTKSDSYPIPRIDSVIDKVGDAKFVSKFDLLKGYWQIPLTERAKEISAFVTPDGFFQYKVLPFGMKNASSTFQRMINRIICDLQGCEAYIDDVVIFSNTWDEHLRFIKAFF